VGKPGESAYFSGLFPRDAGMNTRCPRKMDDQHRLKALDGLRAIAILLVLGYHYFSRWAPPLSARDFYPYGTWGRSCLLYTSPSPRD